MTSTRRFLAKGEKHVLQALEKTAGGRPAGAPGEAKYTPPVAVQRNAELGIALRIYNEEVRGLSRPGGTDIGIARAVQLASGKKIPPRSIKRMKAYFSRHQSDRRHKDWGDEDRPSPGYVAWLLWGGDEGWAWAERIVAEDGL